MTDDTVLNPVDVEKAIRACADRIHRGVKVVTDAERTAKAKARAFDRAYAQAYLGADKRPAHERKYAAVLATQLEADEMDIAELAFKHAERTAWALRDELKALQSVGASVRSMYGAGA